MGFEGTPHVYDKVRERFTPRIDESATAETLQQRVEALTISLDANQDSKMRARLMRDISDLRDQYNQHFGGENN